MRKAISVLLLVSLPLAVMALPRLGNCEVASSQSYSLQSYGVDMGGGNVKGQSFQVAYQSIGDSIIGTLINKTKKLVIGLVGTFLSIFTGNEEDHYDIDYVRCFETPLGKEIKQETWTSVATPYFIWEIKNPTFEPIGYSYSIDGQPDDIVDTSQKYVDFASAPIPEGTHMFYVKAQNNAGKWGQVGTFAIYIDKTAPKVNSYAPDPNKIYNVNRLDITIRVSEEFSGLNLNRCVLKVNGSTVNISFDEESGLFSLQEYIFKDGKTTLSFESEDMVGNRQLPLIWSVSVDTTPPTGSVELNYGAASTQYSVVTLTLSAEDSFSGVDTFRVGNSEGECSSAAFMPFRTELQWTLPPYNGKHKVYVQFKDKAGNMSALYSDEILLELIAPDTFITSGPSGVVTAADAYFRFSSTSAKAYFSYSLDGSDWSQWSAVNEAMFVGLSDGRHVFSVRSAEDVNGNKIIDAEEIDPTPAQRVWYVGEFQPWQPDAVVKYYRSE